MRKVILILGMHRSGTSAMTGAMVQLGVVAPLTLMPASNGNERGYWESFRIATLHDELLAATGSSWHDWRAFDKTWHSSAAGDAFRTRAKSLLDEEFGGAELFAFKDPRLCRLLPFWVTALEEMQIAPLVVIPIRSPLEVAQSLAKRDGFSLEKGLLLWLRHVLDAERESRQFPRAVVSMDDLLEDWRGAIIKISGLLGIEWPAFGEANAAAVDAFLSHDLRHQNAAANSLPPVFAWTIKAYEAMLILRDRPQSSLALNALDEVSSTFELACAFMGPAFAEVEEKVRRAETEALTLRTERNELARRYENLTHTLLHRTKKQRNESYRTSSDRSIDPEVNRERARKRLLSVRTALAEISAKI